MTFVNQLSFVAGLSFCRAPCDILLKTDSSLLILLWLLLYPTRPMLLDKDGFNVHATLG